MKSIFIASALAATFLAACPAIARPEGYDLGHDTSGGVIFQPYDGRDALVIIRYPAHLQERARTKFIQTYNDRGFVNLFYHPTKEEVVIPWIGFENNGVRQDVTDGAEESISKTTYFALGLYKYLSAVLPPGAVHLQPVDVDLQRSAYDASGAIAWGESWPDPLVERPSIAYAPAPIYVDLFAYADPYTHTMAAMTTFGESLAPVVTVRTAPAASPATSGGLATISAFLPYLRKVPPRAGAANGLGVSMVEYLNGISGVPANALMLPKEAISTKLPVQADRILVLPTRQFQLADIQSGGQTPESKLFDDLRQIIVSSINAVSYEKATHQDRAAYVAFFDPELARRWDQGVTLSEADQHKIALLRMFEQVEWKMLAIDDQKFAASAYDGPWGDGMRQQRLGEKQFADELASAQSQANFAMAMTMMSSITAFSPNMSSQQLLQADVRVLSSSLMGMEMREQSDARLTAISQEFDSRLRGLNTSAEELDLQVGDQQLRLKADSLAQLRAQLRQKYVDLTSPPPQAVSAPPPASH